MGKTNVVEEADVANVVFRIEAACGVGDNHGIDSEELEDADGEGDSLDRVALKEAILVNIMNHNNAFENTYCTRPTINTTGVFFSPNNPKTSFPACPGAVECAKFGISL